MGDFCLTEGNDVAEGGSLLRSGGCDQWHRLKPVAALQMLDLGRALGGVGQKIFQLFFLRCEFVSGGCWRGSTP